MSEFLFKDFLPDGGFRLKALDVFNWGTFDSSSGVIYPMEMDGNTSLLVGMNGSGKSTLVDAILTLLVRPVIRNYNLASGASKRERDEKSYIKGAFSRSSGEDDSYAKTRFLRENPNHYTVILGTFENQSTNQGFTLIQVLYLGGESKVKKIFGFLKQPVRLNELLNGERTPTELKQSLKSKGFVVSERYKVYYEYFSKMTGMLPKAMDMFNQTVSVKDINSLNDFIRKHMLEKENRKDKLNAMFGHFADLNKAHQSLLNIRKQAETLSPLVKSGHKYLKHKNHLQITQDILKASESYFNEKIIELFTPFQQDLIITQKSLNDEIEKTKGDIEQIIEKQRQVKNEIEHAGGERLRLVPHLIENEEKDLKNKKACYNDFHRFLKNAGINKEIKSAKGFLDIQKLRVTETENIEKDISKLTDSGNDYIIQHNKLLKEQELEQAELKALQSRRTNLPENLDFLRRELCHKLNIRNNDLIFTAELISVKSDQIKWKPSVEKVLRNFGLHLLVKQKHYHNVSKYIDSNRLMNERGKGQRLSYLRISESEEFHPPKSNIPESESIVSKLEFKPKHNLSVWVKNEIQRKFDFHCCDSIEQFQSAKGFAMTINCHVKRPGGRHEKDDRDFSIDPRRFVLGWDNKEKQQLLRDSIQNRLEDISELNGLIKRYEINKANLNKRKLAWQEIARCEKFSHIEYWPHEEMIASLNREKIKLESSNEKVQYLKGELKKLEKKHKTTQEQREGQIRQKTLIDNQISKVETDINIADNFLKNRQRTDLLDTDRQIYPAIDKSLTDNDINVNNLQAQKSGFEKQQYELEHRLIQELDPIQNNLTKHMGKFLSKFPEFVNLNATPDFFKDFEELQKNILMEGLPQHEKKFKERLNENVIREIALLNSSLNDQQDTIRDKITQLNKSLRKLEYNSGTFMKLEVKNINDPEIQAFRQSLKDCIDGHFDDSKEGNEARYIRIAKLVKRLEDEERWREKVIDVRQWFRFIARELDMETSKEQNAYEDASGQSGGEKAKLAFTILVAAVAYQYNIDPSDSQCNTFRFVVVDEMFSKVDDRYATYALKLFRQFGLQLLIVAPLDPKARVTERFVKNYFHVVKNENSHSNIYSMTAKEFEGIAGD